MFLLRKYGVGSGADVRIPLTKAGAVDFAVGADWTPAAGDVKISIDGGAAANIASLPTALTMGNTALWVFTFSNAELQGKEIVVTVADSATKAVEDQAFIIETFGDASAKFPTDLSAAILSVNASQIGGTGQTATDLGSYIPRIRLHTDQLTFTNASLVDATAAVSATAIRSAIGMDAANLDTQLGRIRLHTDQLTYTNASLVDSAWLQNGSDPTGVPGPTASNQSKFDYVFAHYRGKRTQDASDEKLFANDGLTVIATKTKSDNGTTLTVNKAT